MRWNWSLAIGSRTRVRAICTAKPERLYKRPELRATAGANPLILKKRTTVAVVATVPPIKPVNPHGEAQQREAGDGQRRLYRPRHGHGLGEAGGLGHEEDDQDPGPGDVAEPPSESTEADILLDEEPEPEASADEHEELLEIDLGKLLQPSCERAVWNLRLVSAGMVSVMTAPGYCPIRCRAPHLEIPALTEPKNWSTPERGVSPVVASVSMRTFGRSTGRSS